jgi:hypothetical protein
VKKSHDITAKLLLPSILGEAESAHSELGDLKDAGIIGHGSDNHGSLAILSLHVTHKSSEGDWGLVQAGHAQSLGDNLSKLRIGTSGKETDIFSHQN